MSQPEHEHLPPARHRARPIPPIVSNAPVADPNGENEAKTYEVGYGKPPVHTRFQKGRSGNPKGRKKGSKNVNTLLSELLEERIAVNTPTGLQKIPRIEVLLRKLIELGAKGNPRAIEQILRQYALAQVAPAPRTEESVEVTTDVTDADTASLQLLRELLLTEALTGEGRAS